MCKDPVAGKSCTRENMEATEASVGESRVRRRERWGGEVGKEREEGKRERETGREEEAGSAGGREGGRGGEGTGKVLLLLLLSHFSRVRLCATP